MTGVTTLTPEEGEKDNLVVLSSPATKNHPETITEENLDHDDILVSKSSLSLPLEQQPKVHKTTVSQGNPPGNPVKTSLPERSQSDRRKLSVANVGERRRSTSSIFSDMRKMSITNFENLKSPGTCKLVTCK